MTSIDHKTKYINSVLNQNIDTKQNTKETTSKNRLKLLKKLHNKTKKNNYDNTMLVCKTCKTKFKSFTGGGGDLCIKCLEKGKNFAYISSSQPDENQGECIPAGGIAAHRTNSGNNAWSAVTKESACVDVFKTPSSADCSAAEKDRRKYQSQVETMNKDITSLENTIRKYQTDIEKLENKYKEVEKIRENLQDKYNQAENNRLALEKKNKSCTR